MLLRGAATPRGQGEEGPPLMLRAGARLACPRGEHPAPCGLTAAHASGKGAPVAAEVARWRVAASEGLSTTPRFPPQGPRGSSAFRGGGRALWNVGGVTQQQLEVGGGQEAGGCGPGG